MDAAHEFTILENHKISTENSSVYSKNEDACVKQNQSSEENENNKDDAGKEVAIQANDYEIERNSSHLPARKRYIPIKFSDYRIFAGSVEVKEEEEDDFTFDPEKSEKQSKVVGRGRGRPRKHPSTADDGQTSSNVITKVSSGFKCGVCGRVFSLRGNAKAHMITHTDSRPFTCDFEGCGKQLRTKESLRRHQLSHLGIKMFECKECKKRFSCNSSLQEHMACHSGAKPLSCHICDRKFRQAAVLKRHTVTHSNEKPFACGICGKRFSMKVYVQSHMKTHTGERPYLCDICNKSFAHASDLNRHKIIHSGKKPYACSVCSMRYSDASSRRRHEREHQMKPDYTCHLCNQHFTRSGQLRSHLVKEHSSENDSLYEVHVVEKGSWNEKNIQPQVVGVIQDVAVEHLDSDQNDTGNSLAENAVTHVIVETSSQHQEMKPLRDTMSDVSLKHLDEAQLPGELSSLQSGCTYTLVGNGESGQIFELKLEESNIVPYEELADNLDAQVTDANDHSLRLKHEPQTFTIIEQNACVENVDVEEPNLPQWVPHMLAQQPAQLGFISHPKEQVTADESKLDTQEPVVQYLEFNLEAGLDERNAFFTHQADEVNQEPLPQEEAPASKEMVLFPVFSLLEKNDYVYHPDLTSQDYYNWLSNFTEHCKTLAMPLEKDMFQKISHVQKTLSDFMALPTGVITDRNNFKVLMDITREMSDIISTHLTFMYQNLH
ncbi:myoneurin-like isoform X2 [Physella acuta]|uniref:myoneurin-like isoform X2 n=1 Tax=Physella acuta TaxID=109671 RepID=UPI0027DBC5C4|nr:myoneurin-like isoform X2 [Physella acuta]